MYKVVFRNIRNNKPATIQLVKINLTMRPTKITTSEEHKEQLSEVKEMSPTPE